MQTRAKANTQKVDCNWKFDKSLISHKVRHLLSCWTAGGVYAERLALKEKHVFLKNNQMHILVLFVSYPKINIGGTLCHALTHVCQAHIHSMYIVHVNGWVSILFRVNSDLYRFIARSEIDSILMYYFESVQVINALMSTLSSLYCIRFDQIPICFALNFSSKCGLIKLQM